MNLEEGMYVRTKDRGIAKITEVEVVEEILGREVQPITIYYVDRCFQPIDETKCFKEDIIKASNNIIDLIEVGDYVNGYLVLFAGATTWDNDGNVLDKQVHINHNGFDWWLREEYIKSIVTKEQFESMKYSLEG